MPSSRAATQEPMSPTTGAAISTLLSISLGSMSIWMNFFGASPQALPLPCDRSQLSRAPINITTSESLSTVERALDRVGRRNLGRRRVDDLDERFLACFRIHDLREQFGRQVEINAARTAGHGGPDSARHADADVCGMQHAEGRLAEGLGDRQLVHLFIVALLQVDDLALGRAAH